MAIDLEQLGLAGGDAEFLQEAVDRHGVLLGKLINQVGTGNILYGIDDPTVPTDISDHADLVSAHHVKYTDANAIAAVEGEATLDLSGLVVFSQVAAGVFPTAAAHLATKEYVDSAISFIGEYYFNNTASSYAGIFYKMLDTPTGEAEASFVSGSLSQGDDQALVNFATDAGIPGVTVIESGVFTGHIYAKVDASNKRPVKLHYEIYSKLEDSPFTETLVATSEETDFLTDSQDHYDVHAVLASDVTIGATDRLIIKWLANVDAVPANDVTVTLYVEGSSHARLEIPLSSEVLSQIYLRQDGTKIGAVSQAQDFGSNGIKADVIEESTGAAGVSIDSTGAGPVIIKDGGITAPATITAEAVSATGAVSSSGGAITSTAGQFYSGTDGGDAAGFYHAYGTKTGSTLGGQLLLHVADDHDGAIATWGFQPIEDDLYIFRSNSGVPSIKIDPNDLVTLAGALTTGGNLIIPDLGYIGSATTPTSIQIEADGDVVMAAELFIASIRCDTYLQKAPAGTLTIRNDGQDENIQFWFDDGGVTKTITLDASANAILFDDTTALTGAGAITATSYGGITEANLVDKSAVEAITGAWTFGTDLTSDTDDTDDLGSTSKRWGNLHLAHDVKLDSTPDADHETSGITGVFTANENQVIGDVCYIDANGEMAIADADAIATSKVVGMCADATISADAAGDYILYGIVRDDTWAWTVGGYIFLTVTGTSTNTLSQTAPTGADDCVVIIGVATHADRILFAPQTVIVEHTG